MQLRSRIILALVLNALLAFAMTFVATRVARALEMREIVAYALAMLVTLPVILWTMGRVTHYVSHTLESLDDGLRAFRDSDFSVRLATDAADESPSRVKAIYNDVAELLRSQRNDIYQKELLLDTILQRTPIGVVLVNAADRVAYSNAAARELFANGGRIDGSVFTEIVQRLAAPIRDTLTTSGSAIVTVPGEAQHETFHLTQRRFRLNTLEHRLVLVERLTAELRRQEVSVWKNAIRIINHELNNTIAPISSLVHSARLAQETPARRDMLPEIYETIEERLAFLRAFLESYAQFARLPAPSRRPMRWSAILDDVRALYDFRVEGAADEEALVDRAQMQQVLINLVKNSHESGSDPAEIVVSIQRAADGTLLRVCDRGRGISEEVMRQALIPFFTTKPSGSGLGLALSNEIIEAHGGRMRLEAREGGGTVVTCWLP